MSPPNAAASTATREDAQAAIAAAPAEISGCGAFALDARFLPARRLLHTLPRVARRCALTFAGCSLDGLVVLLGVRLNNAAPSMPQLHPRARRHDTARPISRSSRPHAAILRHGIGRLRAASRHVRHRLYASAYFNYLRVFFLLTKMRNLQVAPHRFWIGAGCDQRVNYDIPAEHSGCVDLQTFTRSIQPGYAEERRAFQQVCLCGDDFCNAASRARWLLTASAFSIVTFFLTL